MAQRSSITRRVTIGLCGVAILCIAVAAGMRYGPHWGRPKIVGSPEFKSLTVAALDLLQKRDPDGYRFVLAHVREIFEDQRSGAHVENMKIAVARPTFAFSPTWYASVLVHETEHLTLYTDYLAAHPGVVEVPSVVYSELNAERACNIRQMTSLKNVGASDWEIDWLKKQDGSSYDLNGDGNYDWVDYIKRNW